MVGALITPLLNSEYSSCQIAVDSDRVVLLLAQLLLWLLNTENRIHRASIEQYHDRKLATLLINSTIQKPGF